MKPANYRKPKKEPGFSITLRAEPTGPDKFGRDPIIRLRQLLKLALRVCGLRCTSIEQAGDSEFSESLKGAEFCESLKRRHFSRSTRAGAREGAAGYDPLTGIDSRNPQGGLGAGSP